MTAGRTTRCCSALALIVASLVDLACAHPRRRSASRDDRKLDRLPLRLFPTRPVWTLALNNLLTVPPAYDATRAFFSIDGDRIVCYELASGSQQWIASAQPQMQPAVGDNLLFVPESGGVTALRTDDGEQAWKIELEEKLVVPPVWDNGWLILSMESRAIAVRAVDGREIWRRELSAPVHAVPALAHNRVYISTGNDRVIALNVVDGSPIWERRLGGAPNEILALEDRLYVGAQDNFLYCLMTEDGRIDWRWRTGGDVIGLPVVDDSTVYFVSLDNVLRALNRKSGGQRWIRTLPFRPAWAPVKVAGVLVVAGQSPSLRAYALTDGSASGEVTAPAEIAEAPHVVESGATALPTLLVMTRDIKEGAVGLLITRSLEPASTPVTALTPAVELPPLRPPS